MAKIEGLKKLVEQLRAKAAAKVKDADCSVAVGYTAAYALYVHENLDPKTMGLSIPRPSGLGVYWGPSGQPKFLEGPFRENRVKYATIVRNALQQGRTLAQALTLAGLELQRDSMRLVPVEYGNLRASAFTRLEVPAVKGAE